MTYLIKRCFAVIMSILLVSGHGLVPDEKKDFIKWVDFTPTNQAMSRALEIDIAAHDSDTPIDWLELLAYIAARYGGNFKRYKESDLTALRDRLLGGETMDEIAEGVKYYNYYREAYKAVLGGFVGEYSTQEPDKNDLNRLIWVTKYGIKAFSPLARNYDFTHFDDFGSPRGYGYKREHLGHDLFARTGTPIIAVESGVVEVMGWNRFGGWRVGIRSFDRKRYYYYAHLRKDNPYHDNLYEGKVVKAGDVIGYLGRTGYSFKENTNGIDKPHLHFGMQIIFDESQKDSRNEIWIDLYELTKFLRKNRSLTRKDQATGEYYRVYDFFEKSLLE